MQNRWLNYGNHSQPVMLTQVFFATTPAFPVLNFDEFRMWPMRKAWIGFIRSGSPSCYDPNFLHPSEGWYPTQPDPIGNDSTGLDRSICQSSSGGAGVMGRWHRLTPVEVMRKRHGSAIFPWENQAKWGMMSFQGIISVSIAIENGPFVDYLSIKNGCFP